MVIITVDVEKLLAGPVLHLPDGTLGGGGLAQRKPSQSVTIARHRKDTHASLPAKDFSHAGHYLQLQDLGVESLKVVCGDNEPYYSTDYVLCNIPFYPC